MFTTYTKKDLESTVDNSFNLVNTPEDEIFEKYQLEECINWIKKNNYERTCLQFPQSLLNDSTSIALNLQKVLDKPVYILADTSYGSCCVDEVAAEHVNADSIIHFGHACLSPVIKLPVLYIFEKYNLDIKKFKEALDAFKDEQVIVFYDDVYSHLYSELCSLFCDKHNIQISRLSLGHKNIQIQEKERIICGRIFNRNTATDVSAVYVGVESITLQNLVLSLPDMKWYNYTSNNELLEYQMNRNKFLMQRSHLVEKVKEAKVIGILIGTLGIQNYLDAAERIQSLIKQKRKKCYTLAVGKPNVAKLANFPEIDVFVCISCQENSLLKSSKDFFKPIVSLYEVEMALGRRPYSVEYTSDFRELLPGGSFHREIENKECCDVSSNETAQELLERDAGTIIESSGAQFLSNRTWQGLEQKIGETEVCKAVQGRSGTSQGYENEMLTLSNKSSDK